MAKKIRFAPIKTAAVHTFSNWVPHRPSLYNPPALPGQRLVTLLSAIGVRAFSCARTPLVTLLQIRGNLFPLSPAFLPPALARSAPDPPVPSPASLRIPLRPPRSSLPWKVHRVGLRGFLSDNRARWLLLARS